MKLICSITYRIAVLSILAFAGQASAEADCSISVQSIKDHSYSKQSIRALIKALEDKGYQVEEKRNARTRFKVDAMVKEYGDAWVYPLFAQTDLRVSLIDREGSLSMDKDFPVRFVPILSGFNRAIRNFTDYIPECPHSTAEAK